MSRYAGFGLTLFAVLVLVGCSNSEPEPPQAPALESQSPPVDVRTDDATSPADTANPEAAASKTEAADTKPTVLSAIGRAVTGALGVSEDGASSEAPAYGPQSE